MVRSSHYADIKIKSDQIKKNREVLINEKIIAPDSPEATDLLAFMKFERENGLLFLNGGNNAKIFRISKPKLPMKPWMDKYSSTGWQTLRVGCWLCGYLSVNYRLIRDPERKLLSQICIQAYEEGIERFHTWIVAKSAKMGMYTVRTKPNFFKFFIEHQHDIGFTEYNEEQLIKDFEVLKEGFQTVDNLLWEFFDKQLKTK